MDNSKRKLSDIKWLLYWFVCLSLVTFGVIQMFMPEIITYIFGGIFIVFGVTRIIPFIKIKHKAIKWINFSEMIIDFALGIILYIFVSEITDKKLFVYLIGGAFYLRGFVHFLTITLSDNNRSIYEFIMNILILTFGTYILFVNGFDLLVLRFIMLGVYVIIAFILFLMGYSSYIKYYCLVNEITMEEYKKKKTANKSIKQKQVKEKKEKEPKVKKDEIENEALKIDPTIDNTFDEINKPTIEEEKEEDIEDIEEIDEEDHSLYDDEIEEEENNRYHEDEFINLDDLLKEKKQNEDDNE